MAKIYKLDRTEDLATAIKRIKNLRDREAVFDVEDGSPIIANSSNLKLLRKTAEVLGKKILLKTDNELAKVLALKAGMGLYGNQEVSLAKALNPKGKASFSDINTDSKPKPVVAPKPAATAKPKAASRAEIAKFEEPIIPEVPISKMGKDKDYEGLTLPERSGLRSWASSWVVWSFVAAVVLLIGVVGLFTLILPKADITVYARSEPITRDVDVTIDQTAKDLDAAKQTVPGAMVTKEVSDTQAFQTTGTRLVGEKASGTVVLYNFTKNTLTLKASTTTLLYNGKKYFFTKDVTGLRPTGTIGSGTEAETDRTTLIAPIPIVAENPGETYNLTANMRFEVKNAALGDNKNVYGMNEVPIAGGRADTIKVMSQADYDRAVASMTSGMDDLAAKELGADQKILSVASGNEIYKTADKKVGDEANEFNMTMIGKVKGLSYRESDLKKLMMEQIKSTLSSDKYLPEDGEQKVSAAVKNLDLNAGRATLTVHFETIVGYKVENSNLAEVLAGKDAYQIKEILLQKPEIDRVDVSFFPAFVKKAPRFNHKIFVSTKSIEAL
ncbi:MAG: hypothetical protein ACM3KM_02110 [Acidobacteriaceae bacterium]